ncbi:MAG: SDR family NAD(P)-dependent oxidoreductase [Cyclobacteriaceae bacterium]
MSTLSADVQGSPVPDPSQLNASHRNASTSSQREPIAIVGIGCRLPGDVNDPDAFWQLLSEGKNAITDVPAERWNLKKFYDPDGNKAGKIKNSKGGFITNVDHFDPGFFGIFPNEAHRMDPQQRLLLEVTYQALENAGIPMESVSDTKTAVFMGVFMNDYWDIQASTEQRNAISPHVPMGASLTSIANRISYVYNLKGPSVTLDTACSSSLVGVHLACQSIWSGESDQALAGGVNVILRPESSIMMSKGNFLSPDGHCKTFDSRANGYVRSEGCGIVVLKPLSQAEADGDFIYATILGSAVNQDGHTEDGFTVPSFTAQAAMLKTAYENAGVDPNDVAYIEAHGTGTPVGDPIETHAFGEVIGKGRDEDNKCWVGSVKTNIGHLESAAGVAGLIKLSLILKNRQIPQNLHFENPNPKIPFDEYRLKVPTQLTELPESEKPLIGGVNSFGAGGTNAHLVLRAYEPQSVGNDQKRTSIDESKVELFTLSAQSKEALKENVSQYNSFLETSAASLADICFTAGARRSALDHRLSVAVRTKQELREKLQAFLQDETRAGMYCQKVKRGHQPKIGFIFSGQGPQWYAMGQELLKSSPLFREVIERIDASFRKLADWSLLKEMSRDEASSRVSETRIAQPAIMAIQIGLTELWKSWGVTPEGCVGHSIGEVAAAYTTGALTLDQAVEVIFHRSRGQHAATDKGKMLAVALTVEEARQAIAGVEEVVSIAAINGPEMLTLSGDAEPLEKIARQLEEKDVFCRFLRVNVPFHSHHMEPLKEELIESLVHLTPCAATIPLYSTVTGKQEDGLHLLSDYWYQNVREPVYFTDALAQMADDGFDTFIEIAPHPVLTIGASDLLKSKNIKNAFIVPSLRRKEDEAMTLMGSLGMLYTQGYVINWKQVSNDACSLVPVPTYAWQHDRYWFETPEHAEQRLGQVIHPHLDSGKQSAANPNQFIWNLQLDTQVHPYIEDHKVDGTVIFPGTGHLEVAYAAAKASFRDSFGFLEDIHFESALFLPDEGESMDIRLEVASDEGSYQIYSKPPGDDAAWTMHSRGVMNHLGDSFASSSVDLEDIQQRLTNQVSVSNLYLELKEGGLQYGEAFRCIQKLWKGEGEILAGLKLSKNLRYGIEEYGFHPALLDASLHAIFAAKESREGEKRGIYLPVHIQRFKLHAQPGTKVWSYIRVSEASNAYLKGDYFILNEDGSLVAEIQGLTCKYIKGSRGEASDETYRGMYAYAWEKAPEAPEPTVMTRVNGDSTGGCLLFVDQQGVAQTLLSKFHRDSLYPMLIEKGEKFQEIGANHYQVNPESQSDLERALAEITRKGFSVRRVMYLWGLDSTFDPELSVQALDVQQQALAEYTLNTLRAVVNHGTEPLLYIVTQGADQVVEGETININQAALYGMGRVLMNEFPFVKTSLVDLGASINTEEMELLYENFTLVEKPRYPEIAIRNHGLLIRKLQEVTEENAEQQAICLRPAQGTAYQTVVKEYGTLDGIEFREIGRSELAENEVEIEVRAAGLNFKDIMNVMGLLNDEAVQGGIAGKNLGLECAGVITRVGKNVTDLSIGDGVMAWAANSYAGYTVTPATCVVKKPAHLSFEEAATITVVYLTAHYSLNYLARISEDDTVLIHAASGGVGIAAICLAQLAGAKVIATAGTKEKRAFVRSLGIEHVFDSRSLKFADQVKEATQGRGVDIVLNSLSGKGITQSIKCLAPFGRFIEIGKADIYQDTKLALKRFGENLSYHAVDVDRLMLQKPKLGKRLFQEVADLFTSGRLGVHPHQVYPISKLTDALRVLSKGGHVGKLVVNLLMEDQVEVRPAQTLQLKAEATYLVTGGASGFGLMLAQWLAQKGATRLVLLSRSGYKHQGDHQIAEALKQQGVELYPMNLDITDSHAVSKVVEYIRQHLPPLKGIIHSAAVLNDATLLNTDTERFMKVFSPKALGAWNLHQATQEDSLDFFLSLSSISSLFGLPGQSNYSSANNFLDRLAQYRQSQGLAGSSVNLGVLGMYAGMSKEGGNVLKVLANQGWLPLSLAQVTQKIETVLLQQPTVRMAANLDWQRFKSFFSHLQDDIRFAHFLQETQQGSGITGRTTLVDQVKAAAEEQQIPMLRNMLTESLAKILGATADQIETDVSISAMGLDSLMLNQLRNWIQQKLEINFPLMKIAKGSSIIELAGQLLEEIAQTKKVHEVGETIDADTSGIASEADIEVVGGKWLVRNKQNQQSVQRRVFCFHPVGAGASMFSHFIYNAPEHTDVLAFQLPGRENRIEEAPYEEMLDLIPDIAQVIRPFLDKPFIIMGHSFGGMVGFELIRYLRSQYNIMAEHLFITGTIAPQLTRKWKERDVISQTAVETNSEERLLSLMNYIDDVEFLKRILPVMRKDMALIMSYLYEEQAKLPCPITAFAAAQDEVVLVDEVSQWREQTAAEFTLEVVDGDHWFLSRNRELILQRLTEALQLTTSRTQLQD